MSRSIRDLRDLICVSRLTYRESDDDDFDSDKEGIIGDIDSLSLTSSGSDTPTGTASLKDIARAVSPDSGFLTTGSPTETNNNITGSKPGSKKKRRKKLQTFPTRHELPNSSPLPPLSSKPVNRSTCKLSSDSTNKKGNFDHMMCYMDASIVAGWLTRANDSVEQLAQYCNSDDNFVNFAHFWLSEFPDVQKQEIYELEFSILVEEIGMAFAVGRESRQIVQRDVLELVSALFREYPGKLVSSKGTHLFLDYLDIMSSATKKDHYRKLLADVRCSTRNRQYAQWLLAIRSFALVNVWTAITNFYRNLHSRLIKSVPLPCRVEVSQNINQQRFLQAIRQDYVDVIHYLIVNGHVNPAYIDSHNRTYIFTGVMNNKPNVVQYLLHRVKPAIDVNIPSDTGNTALHAAANTGHHKIVHELLTRQDLDINCRNRQCEQATPLHLAVMHGHIKVVELLVKAGADRNLKMGDLTAVDIARDFDHTEILALLT